MRKDDSANSIRSRVIYVEISHTGSRSSNFKGYDTVPTRQT